MSTRDRYRQIATRYHIRMLLKCLLILVLPIGAGAIMVMCGPGIDHFLEAGVQRYGLGFIGWPSLAVFLVTLIIKLKRTI